MLTDRHPSVPAPIHDSVTVHTFVNVSSDNDNNGVIPHSSMLEPNPLSSLNSERQLYYSG